MRGLDAKTAISPIMDNPVKGGIVTWIPGFFLAKPGSWSGKPNPFRRKPFKIMILWQKLLCYEENGKTVAKIEKNRQNFP